MPAFQFKNYLGTARSVTTQVPGTFRYPCLQTPKKSFDGDKMVYECTIALSPEEAEGLTKELDALYQENLANVMQENKGKPVKEAAKPYGEEKDKEGIPTGYTVFKTRALAGGISKKTGKPWEFRVKLFNADRSPFVSDVTIGGGTKGKLQFDVTGYFVKGEAGIKLNLRGAQILKLVPAGKTKAEDFGFNSEDMPTESDSGGNEYDAG